MCDSIVIIRDGSVIELAAILIKLRIKKNIIISYSSKNLVILREKDSVCGILLDLSTADSIVSDRATLKYTNTGITTTYIYAKDNAHF
ncbi:MAG: hypothetical protein ACFWT8_13545 [Lacticaseibacillus casei]